MRILDKGLVDEKIGEGPRFFDLLEEAPGQPAHLIKSERSFCIHSRINLPAAHQPLADNPGEIRLPPSAVDFPTGPREPANTRGRWQWLDPFQKPELLLPLFP